MCGQFCIVSLRFELKKKWVVFILRGISMAQYPNTVQEWINTRHLKVSMVKWVKVVVQKTNLEFTQLTNWIKLHILNSKIRQ